MPRVYLLLDKVSPGPIYLALLRGESKSGRSRSYTFSPACKALTNFVLTVVTIRLHLHVIIGPPRYITIPMVLSWYGIVRRRLGMPLATVNQQTIAYEVCGVDGPPILFVHGWACNKEMWNTTLQQMRGLGRCYAIDLLGHGDSSKPDPSGSGYAISAQMQAVAGFIEQVIGAPTSYVGHSMGGMIGLLLAHTSPQLVNRMALLAPAVTGRLVGFLAAYLRILSLPGGDKAFEALFQWTRSDVRRLDWFCRVAYFNDRSVLDR